MSETTPAANAEHGTNTEDAEFVARLRLAVQNGGGLTKVADATGIPKRRLSYYLQGREIRRTALISIAKVAGVSVEWLAVGFERQPDVGLAVGPVMPLHPEKPDEPAKLFSLINMPLFEAALEGSENALKAAGAAPDNWHARAQLICLLYDAANAGIKKP